MVLISGFIFDMVISVILIKIIKIIFFQYVCYSEDVDVTGISADLDVTGVSSFVVIDTIYEVENDSAIIKGDKDKYHISDSNVSMSDSESALSDSSDLADMPGR